ncbi:alpha-1,4-glucan:maltose-1-phosphate maltosyltransferase [Anseongella ginsenosidimutans]|uniref:Alpha-1,4-glucan:maltose-1-phosphate maltosyltransferase n=1 Tax=Anseongella ginsenosidimutans TaxID=496056 RepID=A0A4R3KRQ2_9SPHI|nr:alpha-1,4-glucan--maltose-1-phosphate maltosyltransferase [Anseongella ginsenosidimutans]QEC53086.1 alpha-1,4-glucan--maltose-1-phosphate maltosyltransferase [Anseongella ginsenosidimutans]TCS87702.1 alpha-1,4-glucan:maltose-1-phosphate maltosyltransferase [Anseongella ginsenosidimutans]
MNTTQGRKRVIIANVSPRIEEGEYAAKAIINENVLVSADIFADGHDELAASILVRHAAERKWTEIPMKLIMNDRWEAVFKPGRTGRYQFRLQGWIDHFSTWQKNARKKLDAGLNIETELQAGVAMAGKAAEAASPADKRTLTEWAEKLSVAKTTEGILSQLDRNMRGIMNRYRDKNLLSLYPETLEIDVERQKALFSTWYELFPRSAASEAGKHGTFQDVKKLLPRIARMGFDVLYLPPIHPIGEKKRKGRNNSLEAGPDDPGSPWAIGNRKGGHKAIHPQLGTLKDFRDLVREAGKQGIEIALDIAFQCAPDHPYVTQHPQWFKWRSDGTVQYAENPPKKYEDILPLDFESQDWQGLWEELKSVVEYWIDKGVNIFRVDNPHTKSLRFWEWIIRDVREKHPQVIFLAEAFTRPRVMERLAKAGFTQSYTYFTWRNTKYELEEYMRELTKTDRKFYFRPNFWPNTPDILPPFLSSGGENAHIIRLILAATLSASYGIYGPVYEFCIHTPYPTKEEYADNEKYEIRHWDWDRCTRLGELITRINRIRNTHPALQTTWNIEFAETSNDQIICYGKADPEAGDRLIIAVNLDPFHMQSAHVKIPIAALGIPAGRAYLVKDLISGNSYQWQDEWNYVQLNPQELPAHVFEVVLDT